MKTFIRGIVFLIFLFSPAFGISETSPLKLCAMNCPPYILIEENSGKIGGIGVRLMEEISKRMNLKTELKVFSFADVINKTGDCADNDGLFFILKNEKYSKSYMLTSHFMTFPIKICYLKNKFKSGFSWNTYKDLKEYKLSIQQGIRYSRSFIEVTSNFHYVLSPPDDIRVALAKLDTGESDLALINQHQFAYFSKKIPGLYSKYAFADKVVVETRVCIGISKAHPKASELVMNINKEIRHLKQEGFLKKRVTRYN